MATTAMGGVWELEWAKQNGEGGLDDVCVLGNDRTGSRDRTEWRRGKARPAHMQFTTTSLLARSRRQPARLDYSTATSPALRSAPAQDKPAVRQPL